MMSLAISFFKNRSGDSKPKQKKSPNTVNKSGPPKRKTSLTEPNKGKKKVGDVPKPRGQKQNLNKAVNIPKPRAKPNGQVRGQPPKPRSSPNSQQPRSQDKSKERQFNYTQPISINRKTEVIKEVEVETVTDERLISRRPILDTVSDLSEISFFQKISLVNYFNQKESGKIDERLAREEYRRNSAVLRKETSLLYFLRESAKRNLEHNEVKGYRKIDVRIDPQYSLEDINRCIESKLLASYNIEIIHNNDLLSKMGVDPIIVRMSLKKI